MDVQSIRAAFITSQLDRALRDPGGSLAARVVREFSRYIEWFADSLPFSEKEAITTKLHQLENQIPAHHRSH